MVAALYISYISLPMRCSCRATIFFFTSGVDVRAALPFCAELRFVCLQLCTREFIQRKMFAINVLNVFHVSFLHFAVRDALELAAAPFQ
jgi:hypothetical protein